MKKMMHLTFRNLLSITLGVCVLAVTTALHADTSGGKYYIGVSVGLASPEALDSRVSGINHPTQCDQILRETDETNVVPLSHDDCQVGGARPLLENAFDLETGFMGGISAGYVMNNWRFEFEYLHRSHDGDANPFGVPGGNTALQSKNSEWSTIEPPTERVSDFLGHQIFANVYYDFMRDTRWMPYVGLGAGWARTQLHYDNYFLRKTIAQGYPADKPPAAAGTSSLISTDIADTTFGFQLLGGIDYALTEAVSMGIQGRWVSFSDLEDEEVWDIIRNHAPVRADGTPFTTKQKFADMEYWALSFGLKYHF